MLDGLQAGNDAANKQINYLFSFSHRQKLNSLVNNLYRILTIMTGQRLLHNLPRHRARRLIANLLPIHNATHRTLNVQTPRRIDRLLTDN